MPRKVDPWRERQDMDIRKRPKGEPEPWRGRADADLVGFFDPERAKRPEPIKILKRRTLRLPKKA